MLSNQDNKRRAVMYEERNIEVVPYDRLIDVEHILKTKTLGQILGFGCGV